MTLSPVGEERAHNLFSDDSPQFRWDHSVTLSAAASRIRESPGRASPA